MRLIAKVFGVTHFTIKSWLESHGIPSRPTGRGLANRGISPPDKDALVRMVHVEHLSYPEIAKRFGVDGSAVRHWLIKHDIERPKAWSTRSKGLLLEIKPDEVKERYLSGLSLEAIALEFGVGRKAIKSICKKEEVELRPAGFPGSEFLCKNGLFVRSTYELRTANWLSDHDIQFEYEPRYPFSKHLRADFKANDWFIEVWGVENFPGYEERKSLKKSLCATHEIPLIEIKSHFFHKRNSHLFETAIGKVRLNANAKGFLF